MLKTESKEMLKISTYRELECKNELLPLMDQAFHLPFNLKEFEKIVKIDPRAKNGPIGFCATENEHLVGFVGVWDLPTRNLDEDIEYIGGVYGVATLPGYMRRGICTALMSATHEYFRQKSYSFSFLSTVPTSIAYNLYKTMGYKDLTEFPSAYKIIPSNHAKTYKEKTREQPDLDKILKIYNEYSKTKTGFTIRDKEYLNIIMRIEGINAKDYIVEEQGYVILKKDKNGTQIKEIVALSRKCLEKLVEKAENDARTAVYDRAVTDDEVMRIYRAHNYMLISRSNGVTMIKPLTASASFKQIYGDKFYVSGLDIGC